MGVHQATFLESFRQHGNVSIAAAAAGVDRRQHYRWLKDDATYAELFADALDEAGDYLEAEARRRAVEGLVRYKFNKDGTPVCHPDAYATNPENGHFEPSEFRPYFEREFSDTLLIFLLKGARPEKYADRKKHEHKGKVSLAQLVAGTAADDAEGEA